MAAMRRSEVLAEESVQCLNRALNRLRNIWEEIGIPEDQRLQRTDVVRTHIKGLLDLMIAEEESLKERLIRSIGVCRRELDMLCHELMLPPFETDDDLTILQLEKDLRTRVEVLLKQKKERQTELITLRQRDEELCTILCTPLYFIDDQAVPSLDDLDQYRRHLASLAEEKDRRKAEFVNTKKQIILCMEELDQIPDSSFERDVVRENEESFCLSTEHIASVKLLLLQLEEKRTQNEVVCSQLRSRITELWNRLQIPNEKREAFAKYMTGSRGKTLAALQNEVERLEVLKVENLQHFIKEIRAELISYWDKCFYSVEQRKAFSPFDDDAYTEDLLTLHEDEIARIKHHYEVHKELFEGVQHWQGSWQRYLELEKKVEDPSRLANRGGNLLKEQREHSALLKKLPKLEEELKVRIDSWEQEQMMEFKVHGQKFMDFVSEQWQAFHAEKEREKQERVIKKNRQKEVEMYYGSVPKTPSKRKVPLAQTPGKYRKLNGTSVSSTSSNSTTRSIIGGTICHSPASRPPPSGGTVASRTPNRVMKPPRIGLLESIKENMSQFNSTTVSGVYTHSAASQRNLSVNSVASTYSEFARELSKASRCDTPSRILNSTSTNIRPH
ncbi:protein regulator of cytokinesis 1 isoform X1 [Pleurodeles waltl]|uniref:protein regulator of cytokinesis 1 isoform X1 n=1 Tax=Pleurodeles waltl TaxID=8319 RepID=UPI0037097DED